MPFNLDCIMCCYYLVKMCELQFFENLLWREKVHSNQHVLFDYTRNGVAQCKIEVGFQEFPRIKTFTEIDWK